MTGAGPVVGDVGEMELLRRFQPYLAAATSRLPLSAGDDAAVWQPTPGKAVVSTIDSLVEDVHFRRCPGDLEFNRDLGWKLLAISLSDVAAMGAVPGPSLVALTLPDDWPVADLDALYQGLSECAARWGADLAGGNLSGGTVAVLTSLCLGEVDPRALLRREGCEDGWSLAVTGRLGGAAAALRWLRDRDTGAAPSMAASVDPSWLVRLRRPSPRLAEARALVAAGIPVCLDVSDGLYLDSGRLLDAGLGVVIDPESMPLAEGLRETFPGDWIDLAGGGEDYELLFAGPQDLVGAACDALASQGTGARVIGRFDRGVGVRLLQPGGAEVPAPKAGHRHFSPFP